MQDRDDIEEKIVEKPVQRLCSEIQLFDLCDLERCNHKVGRFCTDGELLARFERISEKDDTRSYLPEEQEVGDEAGEDDAYGDALDGRDDDDRDDWEDE